MKKLSFLLLLVSLVSCGSGRNNQIQIEEIRFGNGGGFTGEMVLYSLNKEGELFKNRKEKIAQLSPETTANLFDTAQSLLDYPYHDPQNLYSFLEISTNSQKNKIVWGAESESVKEEVKELHKELLILTK